MKISAVIVSRNDNYGGHLNERATYCFNSAIETYDEVFYIDWNSETHSLLYDIEDNINFKGNFNHIVITPEIASQLTNYEPNAQKCCEVLGRNIGLRRSTGDWLLSTNIDIIHPKRKDLENTLKSLDKNTFYTISRRHIDWDMIKDFHGGEIKFQEWEKLRDHFSSTSEKRTLKEKIVEGDDYSLVNCCGDFQIAHKNIWNEIRGFEEEFIFCLYTDTNVQKKSVMHGFGLKALYDPALFHIDHGKGGGGFMLGINKLTNDPHKAVTFQNTTQNPDTWGFSDIEIEFETL